jgi:hypothetical protein
MVGEALKEIENRDKRANNLGDEGRETLKGAKKYEVEMGCNRESCDWTGSRQFVDTRKEAGINAISLARLVDHPQHADNIYVTSIKEVK